MSMPLVSVIIPTLCNRQRAECLWRAVRSVQCQTYREIEILVCVNGDEVNEGLAAALSNEKGIRMVRLAEASLKAAIVAGRSHAHGDFFCFLDDDDELLPESVEVRATALATHPNIDAVTLNGYKGREDDWRDSMCRDLLDSSDLFGSLLRQNWNLSCATLFRSSSFGPQFFDEDFRAPRYRAAKYLPKGIQDRGFSWTFAGAKMSLIDPCPVNARGRPTGARASTASRWSALIIRYAKTNSSTIMYIDSPGHIINVQPKSQSRTPGSLVRTAAVLRAISNMHVPRKYRGALRKKLAGAHHDISEACLAMGDWRCAAKHHLYCLSLLPSGLRYLSYTRYLCMPFRRRCAFVRTAATEASRECP